MTMLRTICFSKDRPLQLEAFIESLMHYSGLLARDISVIYTSSDGISYDRLIARHPQVDWVREADFHSDLRDIVARAGDYVLLGCDDVVFKDYFDLNTPIRVLQDDVDVFGFSLRLGTNIRFMPPVDTRDGLLVWDWRAARNNYWSYAWEVSASVYRAQFVLDYIDCRSHLSNPNRFEAYLAKDITADPGVVPPKLACFPTSRCVTVTMNRVQDEYPNEFDDSGQTTPKELFAQYESGLRYDWPKLFRWHNKSVHSGAEAFHLSKTVTPRSVAYAARSGDMAVSHHRSSMLWARVLYWRLMIIIWESARKYMPETLLTLIRRVARRRSAP